MRTTLTMDDDLLRAVKAIAQARSVSIGKVVSELVRKGLTAQTPGETKSGLPVFSVPDTAHPITLADVKTLEDLD